MLRVLNRIKRRLLKGGRIKRFIFYTVGEILLIVIGLLIALQINNWNSERKEEQELNEYLMKVSENVSVDIKLADSLQTQRLKIKAISKKGLDIIVADTGKNLQFLLKSIAVFSDFEFYSKKGGFESLVSSGYVSKLSRSKIDSLLFQYYAMVDDLIREERSFNGYVESMEQAMSTNFPLLSAYGEFIGYEVDAVAAQKAVEELFQVTPYQNALVRGSFQRAILRKYTEVIQTGKLLKAEIAKRVQ